MRSRPRIAARALLVASCLGLAARKAEAHSGPPFPIASTQQVGPYDVSIWSDPDTTDDGSAAGRFWVTLQPAAAGGSLPAGSTVELAIVPADRAGARLAAPAAPIDNDANRRYVALRMDHEGPYAVHLTIDGPLGPAALDASVDATYDLRPAPAMMLVFAMPFVLVGFLWIKLLLRRRRKAA
jgi:hypothetical protein